jgi:hypothetical protein
MYGLTYLEPGEALHLSMRTTEALDFISIMRTRATDAEHLTGRTYAVNTIGARREDGSLTWLTLRLTRTY